MEDSTTRPEVIKFISFSNSTEHGISTAIKTKMLKIRDFLTFKLLDGVFFMTMNVKMPTITVILTF